MLGLKYDDVKLAIYFHVIKPLLDNGTLVKVKKGKYQANGLANLTRKVGSENEKMAICEVDVSGV